MNDLHNNMPILFHTSTIVTRSCKNSYLNNKYAFTALTRIASYVSTPCLRSTELSVELS